MEQQKHMIDQLQTELQAEKARHQNTAKQLQDSKEECSALKEECSALKEEIASCQRRIRKLHNMVPTFRFHLNKGEWVLLGIDQEAAQYTNPKCTGRGGLVMSRDPMQVDTVYEVRVQIWEEDVVQQIEEPLHVGVVTSSPDSLPQPGIELFDYTVCSSDPFSLQAVIVCSGCICDRGVLNKHDIGRALTPLKNNSRVGVSIDCSRRLHLHVNGRDQGVVPCRSLPDQCWAMWDMHGHKTKVKIPLTDLP